jgi:hydrogenase maturation protease
MKGPVLIIGYGNELRGDDAVGPLVSRAVAKWQRPGVRVVEAHQLVAEMAGPLASVKAVVFVDASVEADEPLFGLGPSLTPLLESPDRPRLGHFSEPGWLLDLAQVVYGSQPAAWLLRIPVEQVDLGQPLSSRAQAGMRMALLLLDAFLDHFRDEEARGLSPGELEA